MARRRKHFMIRVSKIRFSRIVLGLGIPTTVACMPASQLMCQDLSSQSRDSQIDLDRAVTASAHRTTPTAGAGPTSVRVCISMVVQKKYGVLAHIVGLKRDATITDGEYSPDKNWWNNPLLIHQDATFPNSQVTAAADSVAIKGGGKSDNVDIDVTLTPHADVTLKTDAVSDCMKGKITATITAKSEFYDGGWNPMANATDSPIAFDFDTTDRSKALHPTTSESRTMPPFSFERYTRDHEKWEPRSAWPSKPERGDWRCTIYVKDVKLVMSGYQYAPPSPAPAPSAAGN